LGLTGLQAQEVIPASGGSASGTGGSATYTVGQVAYTTNTSTIGSVAQGVQQPFEIFVVTSIEEAKGITLECIAYPNPVADHLILKISGAETQSFASASPKYMMSLYDMNGKLLENTKIESNETSIGMSNLVPAIYFLKVTQNNKEIKSFKIIKK
jgi:hypothetical protein